jgi:hypothetical protein
LFQLIGLEIKKKIPHPDTDPLQRAKKLKYHLEELDSCSADYEKHKKQLVAVIRTILMEGLEDPEEAEALCQVMLPHDEDEYGGDYDYDGGDLVDGDELGTFDDDEEYDNDDDTN